MSRRIADALPSRDRSRISDPEPIAGLLAALGAERSRVSVQVEGRDTVYTSTLLESGEEGSEPWLDSLAPADGVLVGAGSRLLVSALREELVLSFRSAVLEVSRHGLAHRYRLALPRYVERRTRREDARVVMPPDRSIPVFLLDSAAKLWQGVLQDISLGGLAVRVTASAKRVPARGERLPSCTVRLDGTSTIQAGLEICHVRSEGEGGAHVLGGRFLTLPDAHQRVLTQFLSRFQ